MAVLFDMDGLLLDTERVSRACFQRTCTDLELSGMDDVFLKLLGLRGSDGRPFLEAGLAGRVSTGYFTDHWVALIDKEIAQRVPVKSGVVALLTQLAEKGMPMAVATSTRSDTAITHLKHAGLLGFFTKVVGGEMVERGKPAPDIYHAAANALSVDAVDCTIFEDSDPGVLAAVRSGGRVVQVPDLKPPSPDTRALGHLVAENILEGGRLVGLIP